MRNGEIFEWFRCAIALFLLSFFLTTLTSRLKASTEENNEQSWIGLVLDNSLKSNFHLGFPHALIFFLKSNLYFNRPNIATANNNGNVTIWNTSKVRKSFAALNMYEVQVGCGCLSVVYLSRCVTDVESIVCYSWSLFWWASPFHRKMGSIVSCTAATDERFPIRWAADCCPVKKYVTSERCFQLSDGHPWLPW